MPWANPINFQLSGERGFSDLPGTQNGNHWKIVQLSLEQLKMACSSDHSRIVYENSESRSDFTYNNLHRERLSQHSVQSYCFTSAQISTWIDRAHGGNAKRRKPSFDVLYTFI
jgi:hypothetical protein